MTDNLPALRETAEVATTDTDSWTSVVGEIAKLATYIADTEFVPKGLRSAPAVAAAVLYGREVGLPPMTSLNMLHVVEGRPGLSAEGMRALVLAAGHDIEITETSGALCTMRGRRRGSETWTSITWTLDMARAAGLLGKNNWKAHPRQMLQARCSTELCRLIFPDVIHGFRSIEELEDMAEGDGPVATLGGTTGTTTKVTRRPRKTAAALPAGTGTTPAPAPAGPPLPGEPGYDDDTTSTGTTEEPVDAELADEPADEGAPADHGDAEAATGSSATTDTAPAPGGTDATSEGGGDAAPAARGDGRAASPRKASRAQERMIFAELSQKFGVGSDDREERLYLCGRVLRRKLTSFTELSADDAKVLIETFGRLADRAALDGLLDTIDQAEEERADVERQDMAGEPEQDGAES